MKQVYLIKSEETGRYKIGVSKNPHKRVKQLQTGSNEKIFLINSFKSNYPEKVEKTLHNQYLYLKTNGEWFDLSLEDELLFIKSCQKIEETITFLVKSGNMFI